MDKKGLQNTGKFIVTIALNAPFVRIIVRLVKDIMVDVV